MISVESGFLGFRGIPGIPDLYAERSVGLAVKLLLNVLYGKFAAQRSASGK